MHPPPARHRDLPRPRHDGRRHQRGTQHRHQGRAGLWSSPRGLKSRCLQASEQSLGQLISRYQESGRGEAGAPQRGAARAGCWARMLAVAAATCLIRAVPARRCGSDLRTRAAQPSRGFSFSFHRDRSLRWPGAGTGPPGSEGTMSHDKIRAAARKRMAETGEPLCRPARRAVIGEHQGAGGLVPSPGAGYALRMSGEIHDWLADLHRGDPPSAARVRRATGRADEGGRRPRGSAGGLHGGILALGAGRGGPRPVLPAAPRPAPRPAPGRGRRRGPVQGHPGSDRGTGARAARVWTDGAPPCAGCPPAARRRRGDGSGLAAVQRQAAEVRRLLPRVTDASAPAGRADPPPPGARRGLPGPAGSPAGELRRGGVLSLRVHQAIAASGLPGDDSGRRPEDGWRGDPRGAKPGSPVSPPRWSGNWGTGPAGLGQEA